MDTFFYLVALVLGLAIGSFLNVAVHRIPAGMSLSVPPSRCPSCGTPIRPVDNIPVVSFLLLGGKCRACALPISWRYPAVEALTGLVFVSVYAKFGLTPKAGAAALFATVLIVVALIDLDTMLIPNRIILPAMVAGAMLVLPGFFGLELLPVTGSGRYQPLIGFLAGGGSLFVIALIAPLFFKKDAMGGGDIKFASFMGLFLGGYVLIALFFGFLIGGIAGLVMVARGLKEKSESIPFGPYLALGGAAAAAFGPQLFQLYLRASGLA